VTSLAPPFGALVSTPVSTLSQFPTDFVWGVATAAYQIEGAASVGGRGPSIWDTFSHTPGLTRNGDTGDIACDHYHRWESDLDLLSTLEITGYRLSLSWSRLQPDGSGSLNQEGLAFYRSLLIGLRERGIQALVTLYHWDLPQTLEDAGGWPNRDTAYRFAEYVGLVLAELGSLATEWITINEPWCVSFLGYGSGAHAPGRKSTRDAVAAAHHLNLAHGLAVAEFRKASPQLRVGITNIVTDIVPASTSEEDALAVARLDASTNRVFLDPVFLGDYSPIVRSVFAEFGFAELIVDGDLEIIKAPIDFVGINHYQRVIAWAEAGAGFLHLAERPAEPATTSFGWSVIPDSLHDVLVRVSRQFTNLPIYVTESGASFDDYVDPNGDVIDSERVSYFSGYLTAAGTAIQEGVNLKGYFAWSFLDNFEWAEGYSKRFGLVYVDYRTQERIPKQSAYWYRQLIADHRDLRP
jgi:beta-glucosidase